MIIIFVLIMMIFSTMGGCIQDPGKDLEFELDITNLTYYMTEVEGANQWIYTFNWETQASATSILYINEGSSYDPITAIAFETDKGTQERSIEVPAIIPLRTYTVHIESIRGALSTTLDNDLTFDAPERPPSNHITGVIDYVNHNQPNGDFIVELWKDSEYPDGSRDDYVVVSYDDYINGNNEFSILAGPLSYRIRIFRDFNENRNYNSETEAFFESSIVVVEDFDVHIGTCFVEEPAEFVDNMSFLYPTENIGLTTGQETRVDLELMNQWDEVFNGVRTIEFIANDPDVDVGAGYSTIEYDGNVITDYYTHIIAFEKADGASTSPVTTLRADLTEVEPSDQDYVDTVHTFTLSLNLIYLTVEYKANGKYDGALRVEAKEQGAANWTYFNTELNESSSPPVPTDAGVVYNNTIPVPADNDTYEIRVYRDDNDNDDYDNVTQTEAYGLAESYTGDPAGGGIGTGLFYIEVDNQNEYAKAIVREPILKPTSLVVTTQPSNSISSGDSVNVEVKLKDQWGGTYAGDGGSFYYDGNPDTDYDLDPQTLAFTSNNNTEVSLVGTEVTETGDLSGTISTNLTLHKDAFGLGSNNTTIHIVWENGVNPPHTSTDTNPVEVKNNHIVGSFTYNQTVQQDGTLKVEMYNNSTFIPANLIDSDTDGDTNFDFEVDNSNGGNYYFRIYRDFSGSPNGYDDTNPDNADAFMDAYLVYAMNPITVNHSDVTGVDLGTLNDKPRYVYELNITNASPTTMRSGQNITIDIEGRDQWGNLYGGNGSEVVDFSWNNGEVVLDVDHITFDTGGVDLLNTILTNTTSGGCNGNITAEINSPSGTNGISRSDVTGNIIVDKNQITGTVSYNVASPNQPSGGRIKVEAWDDASYTTRYDIAVASSTGTGDFSYTLSNIPPDETDVHIRAFFDHDNDNNNYNVDEDAYGTYGTDVNMNNEDQSGIDFDIDTEPAQEVGGLSISTQPSGSIRSGQSVSVGIDTINQWGDPYTGINRTVTFSWVGSNVTLTPNNGNITGATDTYNITLKNNNAGPNTGQIQFTSNGFSDTTNNVTVNRNHITGTVSYNVASPNQPGTGTIKVEAWSDAGYSVTRYDIDIAGSTGTSDFSYTLTNIPSDETTVYLRAFFDYDNIDNVYDSNEDAVGFTSAVNMNQQDQTGVDFDIDTEPPQEITTINVSDPVTTEIMTGDSITFTVTSYNQWGIVYGDTSKDLNHTWLGSSVNINPTFTDIESDGTTSVNVTLTTTGDVDVSDQIECEVDTSGIVDQTTNNIRVDGQSPTVTNSTPTGTGILPGTNVTVTFSEGMNQTSAESAFSLDCSVSGTLTSADGTFGWAGNQLTFNPTSDFASGETCTIEVSTGATDILGNPLDSPYSSAGFTIVDGTAPTVDSSSPSGTDVAVTTNIVVTFSEAMNTATAQTALTLDCSVSGTLTNANGTFSWAGVDTQMTFDPTSNLASEETCTINVSTAAEDVSGNALASSYTSAAFTTEDVIAPTVSSTIPTNGAIDINRTTNITVNFSELMNTTATESAFSLDCSGAITGSISWPVDDSQLVFNPTSDLPNETTCTIEVTTTAEDDSGNALASTYTSTFTTEDTVAPLFSSAISSSTDDTKIIITFDETLQTNATLDTGAFTITETGEGNQAQSVTGASASGTDVTLTISPGVSNGGTSLTVDYDKTALVEIIKDDSGNESANFTGETVTNDSSETTAPSYVSMDVTGGTSTITLNFDENLNAGSTPDLGDFVITMKTPTVTLTQNLVTVSGNTVTITVDETISSGKTVQVVYTTGSPPIEDVNGNDNTGFDTGEVAVP